MEKVRRLLALRRERRDLRTLGTGLRQKAFERFMKGPDKTRNIKPPRARAADRDVV
jgi:hypothetical protein